MTTLWSQNFSKVPVTEDKTVESNEIAFSGAEQAIIAKSGSGLFKKYVVGDHLRIRNAKNLDNNVSAEVVGKPSNDKLILKRYAYSPSVVRNLVTESSGRMILVENGMKTSDYNDAFYGVTGDVSSPAFGRIIDDPTTDQPSRVFELFSPFDKSLSEDSVHFHSDFAALPNGVGHREMYFGYWVYFCPGRAHGFLASEISADHTGDIVLDNVYRPEDFPRDWWLPQGSGPGNKSTNQQGQGAMEIILGDPTDIANCEIILYQFFDGKNKFTGNKTRSWRNTKKQKWPKGTRVTIGYGWGYGEKLPGMKFGKRLLNATDAGIKFASCRTFQSIRFGIKPYYWGVPNIYRWDGDESRHNPKSLHAGYDAIAPGYDGGPVLLLPSLWTAYEYRIKQSSGKGKADGEIDLWINKDHVIAARNIIWRKDNAEDQMEYVNFMAFAANRGGGADVEFHTQKDELKYFSNFQIGTNRLHVYENGRLPELPPAPAPGPAPSPGPGPEPGNDFSLSFEGTLTINQERYNVNLKVDKEKS